MMCKCGHTDSEHGAFICNVLDCRCQALDCNPGQTFGVEPSQARYRSALAMQRLANALGIELRPEEEDCLCLERLASQAERWRRFDERAPDGEGTREKAYAGGYGSDVALRGEGEP